MQDIKSMVQEIIDKAEKSAKNIISDAEIFKQEKLAELTVQLQKSKLSALEKANADAEDVISRRMVLANLDLRKEELKAKQQLIDTVYDGLITKLLNMTDNVYREFIEILILKYADNNDRVVLNDRDIKRISDEWVAKVGKKKELTLSLSFDCHKARGGIILSGKNCDKNLTFETLIKALRNDTEGKVHRKLFE